MTAKEYLNQAYLLDNQINADIKELESVQKMSQSISSPSLETNYNASRNTDAPYVRSIEKIMLMEQSINEEIDRLVDLKEQISQVINSVPNPNERLVLKYRYVDRMKWDEIGKILCADPRTVRRWSESGLSHVVMPKNPIRIQKSPSDALKW